MEKKNKPANQSPENSIHLPSTEARLRAPSRPAGHLWRPGDRSPSLRPPSPSAPAKVMEISAAKHGGRMGRTGIIMQFFMVIPAGIIIIIKYGWASTASISWNILEHLGTKWGMFQQALLVYQRLLNFSSFGNTHREGRSRKKKQKKNTISCSAGINENSPVCLNTQRALWKKTSRCHGKKCGEVDISMAVISL